MLTDVFDEKVAWSDSLELLKKVKFDFVLIGVWIESIVQFELFEP